MRSRTDGTPFIGREVDVDALAERVGAGVRLLTVLGPPGIGKTRLCRELAVRAREHFAGGAWFCELAEARSADDVLRALAHVLELTLDGHDDRARAELVRALDARGETLLVLDNVEQIIGPVGSIAALLISQAPDVQIVATSREPLRIRDENRYELGPLPERDSVKLFEECARARRASFRCDPPDAALLARIVERLDHLPLAIQLAAARADVLSLQQISDRLDRRFDLLRADLRDVEPRHATLVNAIRWSWGLLLEWEQVVLAQCAVFRAGFSVEAAEAVVICPPEAPPMLEALEALRARSLLTAVEREHGIELGMYESIRDFAAGELERRGGRAEAELRHARYHLEVAERWRGAPAAIASELLAIRDRFDGARPADAARAVLALEPLVRHEASFARREELLDGAVDAAQRSGDEALRARALLARGTLRIDKGRFQEGVADADAALALAREHRLRGVEAGALFAHATVSRIEGRPDEALERLEAALAIEKERGARGAEGTVLYKMGVVALDRGWIDQAERWLTDALAIHESIGGAHEQGMSLNGLGMIAYQRGRWDEALALYRSAADLHGRAGSARWRAVAAANAASVHHEAGRFDEALTGFSEALSAFRDVGARSLEASVLALLALVHLETGRVGDAATCHRRALAIHRDTGDTQREAIVVVQLGYAALLEADAEGAERRFSEALALGTETHPLRTVTLAFRGAARAELGRTADAATDFAEARRRADGNASPWERTTVEVLAGVRERVDRARPSSEVAATVRIARRVVARSPAPLEPSARGDRVLQVGGDGRWFALGAGDRVELARRGPPRRLLCALVERRLAMPGHGTSAEALVSLGWPGERITTEAALMRVRVAIRTLRELGLRDVLLTHDDGYVLDPTLPVDWA